MKSGETDDPTLPTGPLTSDLTRTASHSAALEQQPSAVTNQGSSRERYQIISEHGRGGLGRVWRAHDRELGRDVAIKELFSRGHISEVRFLREAKITARLEHPGIVPVHEAGRWPNGTPYYAMKLVSGRPLRDLIAERTTVDQRIALLHHVIAVADAIAYAHGRGIIHRDLKPANIIVGEFGETIVIDWGLAKDLSASDDFTIGGDPIGVNHNSGLTADGAVLGTPTYMAPEQERGNPVDQRADVFAIGAMLWELCSLQKVPPANLRQRHRLLRRAGVDRDLCVIIDKALDPDPKRRYVDAGDLAADLKAFKSGVRISARSYSLLGMLAHWTKRHRTLAFSMAALAALTAVGTAIYIRNVTNERDRADEALIEATKQTRQAVIANATLLLERDPTQASVAIMSLDGNTQDAALLRARIEAAGTADMTIPLPSRVDHVELAPSRSRLVVSTADRSLFVIDLHSGMLRKLRSEITEPAIFALSDDHVYVVVAAGRLSLVRVSLSSGIEEHLTDLLEPPEDLQVSEVGVFWRDRDKTLHELTPNFSNRIIARDVEHVLLNHAQIAICDIKHIVSVKAGNSVQRLGQCLGAWSWAQSRRGFAVPSDNGRVSVYFDNLLSSISFISGVRPRYLSFADSGLITAVDTQGQGAIWVPGSDTFKAVRLGRSALGTNAFGSIAAWDFIDGSVKVVDTNTNREWSFQAHDHGIFCTYVLPPGDRLVTCGRKELRVWTLRHDAPVVVANLPASAFNIARNSQGDLLFDSVIGKVNLVKHNEGNTTFLHQHTQLSFSAAWCAERACSGGWDGRVLCTSINGNTEEVASYGTAIRWITERAGHCFAAVSNGGIYDVSAPNVPLYRHEREPYRVSVSPSGTLIASVDWNGSLQVWSIEKRRTFADLRLHTGLIINAVWIDDNQLVTAGVDGYIYLLGNTFDVKRSWRFLAPVQYIAAVRDAIIAATTDGTIWRISLLTDERKSIPIKTNFTAFAISSDNATIALGSEGSEVFLVDRQFEITTRRFERGRLGRISCLMFRDEKTLLACLSDGRVMEIPLDG